MTTTLSTTLTTKELGNQAEDFAADYLISKGLVLLDRNVNFKVGEIDLIMRDKDAIVFVEVRRRKRHGFGGAIGSITATKQKRLTKAALAYLQRHKLLDKVSCRFDLFAVEEAKGKFESKWIKNIFQ